MCAFFVLFVDDDKEILEIAEKLVISFDERFTIETACSAQEALEKMKEKEYEAIISDYLMPEMDGLDLLKKIRGEGNNIPFIMLTGKGREEIAIEALNLGANRYIQKVGSPKTLYTYLAKMIIQAIKDWRNQLALELSEQSYRLIVQSANDAIFLHERTERGSIGRFLQVNNKLCTMLGYSEEELLQMAPVDIITNKFFEEEIPKQVSLLQADGKVIFETTLITKEGKVIPVEVNAQHLEVTGQEINLSIVRDLTERKEAERKISDNLELTKQYLDIVDVMIVALNRDQTVTMINQKGCEMLGKTENQIIGKNWFDNFIPESDREEVETVFNEILAGNIQPFEYYENPIITKGGEEKIIAWSNSTIRDESGKILTILSSGMDITQQKVALIKLEESEERFKTFFNSFPHPVYLWKKEGTSFVLVSYNEAGFQVTNGKIKELLGIKLNKMYKDVPEIIEDVTNTYESRSSFQKEINYTYQTTGKISYMRITFAFLPPDSCIIYTEDLAEEKRIERALIEEEAKSKEMYQRTQTYLKLVGVMILVLDHKFNIISINPKGCEILGYSEEELVGQPWLNFVPERLKSEISMVEDSQVIRDKEISYHENVVLTKDGKERMIAWDNTTHLDEQGNVLYYISSGQDITEKQQANEKRIFLHQLLRHDVRNKAFISQSFLDLLLETELDEEQRSFVKRSKNALSVTSNLVDKIKDLLNVVEEQEIYDLNLNKLLSEVLFNNQELAEENGIDLIMKCDNSITVQAGDLLSEFFSNIIENAIKHSNCTVVEISTELIDANEVRVIIEDNGKGIDSEIKEHLFLRNVKGKESSGSGLGLYLCRSIIEKYGGQVVFCDTSLGGACFKVLLKTEQNKNNQLII